MEFPAGAGRAQDCAGDGGRLPRDSEAVIANASLRAGLRGVHGGSRRSCRRLPGGRWRARAISDEFLSNPSAERSASPAPLRWAGQLIRGAAQTIKPLSLELGGLAPVLVFDDCDLDRRVRETLIAKFRNTGQSCIAANRIYVQRTIYDEFLERFAPPAQAQDRPRIWSRAWTLGPLINQQRARRQRWSKLKKRSDHGAKVLCGGKRIKDRPATSLSRR